MYDIINLVTGELEESGFENYADAVRYFEANGYNYESYGISGPAEEDDDYYGPFGDPSHMY